MARKPILLLFSLFIFNACSLKPGGDEYVNMRFRFENSSQAVNAASLDLADAFSSPLNFPASFIAPSAATGFDCFAVNVVGPGIPPSPGHNQSEPLEVTLSKMYGGASCTYPGITSVGIAQTSPVDVKLTVPAGPGRIIQVIGFKDPLNVYCNAGIPFGLVNHQGDDGAEIYEVGRAVVDLFSSRLIAIGNSYDSLSATDQANRKANCGGNSFQPSSIGGLRAWFKAETFGGSYADGQNISTSWMDQSPTGMNLAAVNNPVFRSVSGPNGKPFVRMTQGSANYFTTASGNLTGVASGGLSVFVVANRGTTGDYLGASTTNTFSVGDSYFKLGAATNDQFVVKSGTPTSTASFAAAPSPAGFYLFTAVWNSADNTNTSFLRTTAGCAGPCFGGSGDSTPMSAVNLSAQFFIGGFLGGVTVDVGEVVIYNRALTSSEQSQVKSYLANKYGLPQ